jgi:hypothetical protein
VMDKPDLNKVSPTVQALAWRTHIHSTYMHRPTDIYGIPKNTHWSSLGAQNLYIRKTSRSNFSTIKMLTLNYVYEKVKIEYCGKLHRYSEST